jgi:hypothetical protein
MGFKKNHLGNEVIVGINRSELREEREGVHLLNDEAQNGKHGKAAVLELSLAQHTEIKHVGEPLTRNKRSVPIETFENRT